MTTKLLRKIIVIICCCALLLTTFTTVLFATTTTNSKYLLVTNSSLNIRSGAGTSYSVLSTISKGTTITELKSSSNGWVNVSLQNGTKGYCSTRYLSIVSGAVGVSINGKTTAIVNLRSGPGTSYSIKQTVANGTTVTVNDNTRDDFAYVTLSNGTKGYISKDYLTINFILSSVASTTVPATKPATQPATKSSTQPKTNPPTLAPTAAPTKAPTSPPTQPSTSSNLILVDPQASVIYTGSACFIKTSNNTSSASWKSSNNNVATVSSGLVTTHNTGTATITASDSSGKTTTSRTLTVVNEPSGNINLSNTSISITRMKTVYVEASYSGNVSWSTSDASIAAVNNGMITGIKAGTAIITAMDPKNSKFIQSCVVTVNPADPMKFSYSNPNSALLNKPVTFTAITDQLRTSARFDITLSDGSVVSVPAAQKTTDGNDYIWTGTYTFTKAGTYNYTAYTQCCDKWSTCSAGKNSVYVSGLTNNTDVSTVSRRASDNLIQFIANYEGYASTVYNDQLAGIPTVGYGLAINPGDVFYNNLTKNEAFACLINTVNNGSYTQNVNDFLTSKKVKFNQQQFDALVSFVYNLGSYSLSNSGLQSVLLNCDESQSSSSNTLKAGTVGTVDSGGSGLNFRSSPSTSSSVIKVLSDGTKVTLINDVTIGSDWYYVKLSDGTKGYCYSEYLDFPSTATGYKNFNLLSQSSVINEFLQWHHVGTTCVWGLLYRRVDEMEIFFYGDYTRNGDSNSHHFKFACPRNSSFSIS
ncbi:MAG: SH3 domain-containing protein [Bacillota bacterium]|nr:SH3 domain-containing protein [Bacillota bacterium]